MTTFDSILVPEPTSTSSPIEEYAPMETFLAIFAEGSIIAVS